MPTERAFKILGEGKEVNDESKIKTVLETEQTYLEGKVEEYKDEPTMQSKYKDQLNHVKGLIDLMSQGYIFNMYSYQVDDEGLLDLINH